MDQNGKLPLRICFIAGGLGQGGAEKQFVYMLRALRQAGVEVQVMAFTKGEFHENAVRSLDVEFFPIPQSDHPAVRVAKIAREVRKFQPHFLQATHFFTSFYAGLTGRLTSTPSIGAIRSDLHRDLEGVGRWSPWLLRLPSILLANSWNARKNALQMGLPAKRVHVLHNVIDLQDFDRRFAKAPAMLLDPNRVHAVMVGRLVPVKRMERFLEALSIARKTVPTLNGLIIGGGPEEKYLRAKAAELGLDPDSPGGAVQFLGERSDIPQLLKQCDIFVLTSDREGFPNVLLEAMAAKLPVIATPAGETPELIHEGENGHLVSFDDISSLADHLVYLAASADRRKTLGQEGRRLVEARFSYPRLERNLIDVYHAIARQLHHRSALSIMQNSPYLKPQAEIAQVPASGPPAAPFDDS